ncbi:MAG: fatty acid--CoA ligase [Chloroflexi bacterium]|nr:fatty acid--CoA ligase [Chloroflexota bacterium]
MIVPFTPLEFRERAVTYFGNKVGIVDGDKRFTYADYDVRINRLANSLTDLGVGQGEVASFITYNSHQLLEAYYALPQIHGVLNPINIRLSQEEIGYILNHAETKILFFHQDFLPLVEALRPKLPNVKHFVILEPDSKPDWAHDYEELLAKASPEADYDIDSVDENAVVELFYTSGTTGPPKGVAITNRTLYIHTILSIPGFRATDRDTLLHVVPLFHVNGWGTPQVLTALGGKHVMLRKVDYDDMLRLIEAEGVTKLLGVPTIFNGLVNHPDLGKYDLSSLEECVVGGAPSPLSLIEELEEKLGVTALVGYGLTETTPFMTSSRPKDHMPKDDESRRKIQVKTGMPNVGVRVRVVDEAGNEVPRDEKAIGEIITRSNIVMQGYLKDKEGTDAVIVDGWFHTGDMAVIDEEGFITIVDRKKDIIISGGENISSVEVEKVIQNHPAVFEAIVIGVPDEKWGEVGKALVVLKPDAQATEADLKDHVREHLAGFKVPKTIDFMDELPKGGTGKILKRDLRAPYWEKFEKKV